MNYDNIPWSDTKTWKPNCWYPLPLSSLWSNPKIGTYVDGWEIFKLEEDSDCDIVSIFDNSVELFSLRTAIEICQSHNGWKFEI